MKTGMIRRVAALGVALSLAGQSLPVSAEWLYEQESDEDPAALVAAADAAAWAEESAAEQEAMPAEAEQLSVAAKGSILIEMTTGEVLVEQNSHERLPIASVTKIMTLLLIAEAVDAGQLMIEETVVCSAEAAALGGSQIWLEEGESMTVDDLLKAIAVVSANDACAMMAERLCGTQEAFVEAMNRRAAELGMIDTQFLDSCGLNDAAYSCAADVATMARELMTRHAWISRYTTIWMDTLRDGQSQLVNTNKLVRYYEGATGLKTGTTAAAGHCLAATAEKNGLSLCAVVLGCSTTKERFASARQLLDVGFARYQLYTPSINLAEAGAVPVRHGTASEVTPTVEIMTPLLLKKGEETQISYAIALQEDVEAPVLAGQTIGSVVVYQGEEERARYSLVAATAVDRLTVGVAFGWLWRALLA